jgi:hypothetical protein
VISTIAAIAATPAILLSAHTTAASPHFDVTAGPAKATAIPGATVQEKVWNYGTAPETITIGVDEIGHVASAGGACGFTNAAPLAVPAYRAVHLAPGGSATVPVHVNATGPAGYHAVTVDFTLAGNGAVKVSQGVATVIGVTYPGSSAAVPCVSVAQTPTGGSSEAFPITALGLAGLTSLGLGGYFIKKQRKPAKVA